MNQYLVSVIYIDSEKFITTDHYLYTLKEENHLDKILNDISSKLKKQKGLELDSIEVLDLTPIDRITLE